MKNLKSRFLVGLSSMSVASLCFADGMDMSKVTDALAAAGVAVATVGAAALVVYVGGRVWKYVRGAL